jgi:hypothetical protein
VHVQIQRVVGDVLVASLSFQFPDIDGFGTGFLIFNLILAFSDLTMSFTALVSSRLELPPDSVAEGAAVH